MKASDYTILATSERHRDVAAFWRRQLALADDGSSVFASGSTPPHAAEARATVSVPLGPRALAALDAIASDELGRYTVITAGIALALARYGNRAAVLLRTPLLAELIAGAPARLNDQRDVPLVFAAREDATLKEFLAAAANVVEENYSFQDFPIHILAKNDFGVDLADVECSLSCAAIHDPAGHTRSPVHFVVAVEGMCRLDIDFDPGAVEPYLIDGLAPVIAATLDRFDDLSTRARDIPRIPAAERERLLFEWNRTANPARFAAAHALFEDRADESPDAVAIRWGTETVSYGELNARANRLAHYLKETAGPSPESMIGIWMDRSPWMVAAVLGVLKAGRAYVPIDADCPPERLAFLIGDAGVRRLLTDGNKAGGAGALPCEVVVADRELPGAVTNPLSAIAPSDLAYVIYTSGSTGLPKGCAIEHHSLTNYLRWANAFYWPTPAAGTMGLFTPLSFDLTIPSLFCPLLRGRTLVVFPQHAAIQEVLEQQFATGSGIDSVKLTPSHIRVLGTTSLAATDVRLVIVGGEALTTEQVATLHGLDPRIRIVNEYGPTEATVGCVVTDIAAGEAIVIGRPIDNTQAYVLDAAQQPVAVGIRGELCIGGEGVARGYLERPELDAARFLPNPFEPGGRIYRTGDVARWLPGGELECFGRLDSQVKIRGYRIEPGEIEAALRRCAGVGEALVVAVEDELVAYVVSDAPVDGAALRAALGGVLPAYMVPSVFIGLAELPLTPNGKVDRRRLPAPSSAARGDRPRVAPRNERERVIAGIWSELFHRDDIGVEDNFFELGGHSLRAMTLVQRVHQALGLEASIGEVLAHPTVAGLAEVLLARSPTQARPIPRVPAADDYAVSHGQRRLWLIDRIEEESPAYNILSAFDLRGALDRRALATALDALIARHESLRTVFLEIDEEPRQKILPVLHVPIAFVDLRTDADRESRLRNLVATEASAPFNLAAGPLLRVAIYQLEDTRAILALTIHHIVSDAWSMRVLIADLITLYDATRPQAVAHLPALAIQYKDYAAWQRREIADGGMSGHRDYWLAKLAGDLPVLNLPADFVRPPVPTYRGRHVTDVIGPEIAAKLRALGAAHGASPFMVLVAIVKVLLYRYTGQTDIRVGSPIAGRAHRDTADQIGFYVNTLVLRDTLAGDESFGALLTRVKRTAEEAYEHQPFPFDLLVDELTVARDISRSPLFDVMVVHDSEGDGPLPSGGIAVEELRLDSGVSKFDLTFAFAESQHGIAIEIEYRTDLFRDGRIETMAAHLIQLAGEVAADAGWRIEELELDGLAGMLAAARPAAIAPADMPAPRSMTPVAPRDERELLLVGVLEAALGRGGIGVTDNFFHIGGDSIKAIQVASRLARQGWALRVRDVFEAPEIAALAKRLSPANAARRAPAADGVVPLTPIERWFFLTQPEERAHFNQSVMLRFPGRVDEVALHEIGRALTTEHASLRLRFRVVDGSVTQTYGAPYDPVEVHDLRDEPDPAGALTQLAAAAQRSLDLESGALARMVLFRLPDGDRLLAVIHHLAVDGVSWRILLEDLGAGLAQAARGHSVRIAQSSDSYQMWSLALEARLPEAAAEASWWRAVETTPSRPLPYDANADDIVEADAVEHRFSLSADDTHALLSRVHQAYNTRTPDVLLAALTRAVSGWAGPGAVRVDVESHGRDGLDGVDVSRTVGWFTALYPVVLDIGREEDPGRQLTVVKDALRRTPGNGLGYGLLRGGAPSGAAILFNYLGQFDTDVAGFEIADEDRGPELGPGARMTHALVIGGWVSGGRLQMTVRFSRRQFREATVARFVNAYQEALATIVAHCRDRATRERTFSDFRCADAASAALLERLGAGRVEDMYPLSPTQLGMLYHAALDESAPVYLEQFSYAITGPLDVAAFRVAWERVIARHAALRSAVFWRDIEHPLQVVFAHADAPWAFPDWRALPSERHQERLAAFAAHDRQRGMPLDTPPLMRFALIRLGDETYRFYWTAHHLILDGWSTAIVVREVMAGYQSAIAGGDATRDPARQFGEFIDWLRLQDAAPAEEYWRSQLQDFSTSTPLPAAAAGRASSGSLATSELHLPHELTAHLDRFARENGLTLNTLARGAWAALLAAHSGQPDVVFGATVAGRPAGIPDVDAIVGLFINTVPVRVRVDVAASIVSWLHRLQIAQSALDQYSFSALADIQRLSAVPPRTPLFESVLVVENYPVDQSIDATGGVSVEELPAVEETNYPLTLIVGPGKELLLRVSYDTARYDGTSSTALLAELRSTFERIGNAPQQTVGDLVGRGAPQAPAAARHAFQLGAPAMSELRAIADRNASDSRTTLGALIAVLAFRYSSNEDLRCALGSTILLRDALTGDADFSSALRHLSSHRAHGSATTSGATSDLAFDIVDAIDAAPTGLWVETRSESGRFDQAFLRRSETHVTALIAAVAAQPEAPIASLNLLPDDERARLIGDFNRTDKDWGAERTIVQYFEEQAAAHPDRCALRLPAIGRDDLARDATLTYGELNARANQLAHLLVREHAIRPDVRVGVLAERSLEMVLSLVAIEKAGGCYVPLDPDYPPDLLHFMMEDSGAAVILTEERFQHLAAGFPRPTLCLDAAEARLAREPRENLGPQAGGDDLAYVIYTSGSTGRPKGAMNTHRAIANRLLWMQDAYGLTERDRVLQKTPFTFDVSVWEFFWPLMAGAALVLAKPGGHRDAAYLTALIGDAGITTLHFVPSMLQAFIEEPGVSSCRSLKRVICSGEAVTPELLRRYLSRLDVPLYNLYGPTEAAVDVTAWPLTASDTQSLVPIGKPIANIQLYILDERLQPVPLGVTGELFLGGVGVGRGYLNRDELTAAKFIPDPFRPSPAARLYRTGDLARYRDDGVVDFLGRIDHQVKLRGFRIELGEVESALLSHPAIRECVVVVREDQPGMKRLVAYVVLTAGIGELPPDLAAHLQQRLASHMIPGVIVPLDELPRLTNGKLDRKALPVPETRLARTRHHVAPRDLVERRLVRVWEDVLGQSMIGVTDDFFERGGHSILAMQLVSAIQIEFGRSLPLTQLLSHSTIERLAVALKGGADLQDWRPLVEIRRGRNEPPLFLLPGAGGNVIYFHTLAALLTTTRPIYGLQAIGLDGRTPPLATVESIAAANIEEMRRAWPSGPYLLAGHSFGGRVALEMAQQLQRQDLEVALLGVLDTAAPTFEPSEVGAGWTDAQWLVKIAREIEEFFGIRLDVTLDELAPLPPEAQLTLVVERMQRAGAWAPGADPSQLRGYLQVYKANTQAPFVRYDESVTRVPVALFKAGDRDPDIDAMPAGLERVQAEHDWGWHHFARGVVRVFDVPGAHLSMLADPHVRELARALDEALLSSEALS